MLNKYVEEMSKLPPHTPQKSSPQIARSKDGHFIGSFLPGSITSGRQNTPAGVSTI